jgi:hypothetical protein
MKHSRSSSAGAALPLTIRELSSRNWYNRPCRCRIQRRSGLRSSRCTKSCWPRSPPPSHRARDGRRYSGACDRPPPPQVCPLPGVPLARPATALFACTSISCGTHPRPTRQLPHGRDAGVPVLMSAMRASAIERPIPGFGRDAHAAHQPVATVPCSRHSPTQSSYRGSRCVPTTVSRRTGDVSRTDRRMPARVRRASHVSARAPCVPSQVPQLYSPVGPCASPVPACLGCPLRRIPA